MEREDQLQIPSSLNIVSEESGQIFYDYNFNLSGWDVLLDELQSRSVIVGARTTVVDDFRKIRS